MKLHWSPRSPFVRKVVIVMHERGLVDDVACVRTPVSATDPSASLMRDNPIGQIPTLVLEDGTALYDSGVICEYLDSLGPGEGLFPTCPGRRWTALRRQALADGTLAVLLSWRRERDRPVGAQSDAHLAAFRVKTESALRALETESASLEETRFDIGHISIGCMLSYLGFRFPDLCWREAHPALSAWHAGFEARPSARATAIVDGP